MEKYQNKTGFSISQNYYRNSENLRALIKKANFTEDDIVIDIGAGKGVITKEILNYSNNVVAIEPDRELFQTLKNNLQDKKVKFLNIDFDKYILPFLIIEPAANI